MAANKLRMIPRFQNGMGIYIPQIKRIVFNYCELSGSSTGLIQFFKSDLSKLAESHPHIHFVVVPRPGHHPLAKGLFLSGRQKVLCIRNMSPSQIVDHLRLLTDASDAYSKSPIKGGVTSVNPAIRGIWNPFKTDLQKYI